MMGTKERAFGPLPPVTLEELVPSDSFYRHLERSLDLSFVRDLVHEAYAETGRPSIDPVICFKTHPTHCPRRAHQPHERDDPRR